MCGCGSTSRPPAAANEIGPMWSKKTKGPTPRPPRIGSTRRTVIPPTSRARESTISFTAEADAAREDFGSTEGRTLIRPPYSPTVRISIVVVVIQVSPAPETDATRRGTSRSALELEGEEHARAKRGHPAVLDLQVHLHDLGDTQVAQGSRRRL